MTGTCRLCVEWRHFPLQGAGSTCDAYQLWLAGVCTTCHEGANCINSPAYYISVPSVFAKHLVHVYTKLFFLSLCAPFFEPMWVKAATMMQHVKHKGWEEICFMSLWSLLSFKPGEIFHVQHAGEPCTTCRVGATVKRGLRADCNTTTLHFTFCTLTVMLYLPKKCRMWHL